MQSARDVLWLAPIREIKLERCTSRARIRRLGSQRGWSCRPSGLPSLVVRVGFLRVHLQHVVVDPVVRPERHGPGPELVE